MARTKNFSEEEVLDKAVKLFWEKGYNATSANDLVEQLGLSRSSLYDTYGDKRTLFIQSLNRYRSEFVKAMITMIGASTDIKTTIKDIFKLATDQDITDKIPKGCFMVNSAIELSAHDSEVAEIVAQNQRDIENSFEKAILKGQAAGTISDRHDGKSLATFLFNSLSGIRVAMKYNKSRNAFDQIININLSILDN
jgi:TetR/AcrR family transcriptional regulator, transcriptional repressor for nem operon